MKHISDDMWTHLVFVKKQYTYLMHHNSLPKGEQVVIDGLQQSNQLL
jgi:hypothetical protein